MGEHSASGINGPNLALASSQTEAIQQFPGPEWKMDSTACLVRSDAIYFDLSFQFLSAGQSDMEQNNPIPRHLKLQMSLVAARLFFLRICEHRTHASM
jgi:hypothetical protein